MDRRSYHHFFIGTWRLTETAESYVLPPVRFVGALVPATMLEGFLGGFLSTGMRLSYTRRQEDLDPFTRAVGLHLPFTEGDFTLEVCLLPSFGNCVLEVSKLSVESLRPLLGDFLFKAMQDSKYRMNEEMRGKSLTSAVDVLKDDIGDTRLRVKANYEAGLWIWNLFSPTPSIT